MPSATSTNKNKRSRKSNQQGSTNASAATTPPAEVPRRQSRRTGEAQQQSAGASSRAQSPENSLPDEEFRTAMSGGGLQQSPVVATNLASTVTTTEKFRVVSTLSYEEIKRLQHFVTSGEAVGGQYNYSRLLDPAAQRMLKVFCSTRAEDDRDWWTWESGKLFSLLFKHFPAPSQASAAGADACNYAKSMVLDLGHTTTACLKRGELFAIAREKTQAEDLTPDVEMDLVQKAMKRQIATAVGPTRRYREKILEDAIKAASWEEAEEAIFKATSTYSDVLATLKNDYGMEMAIARAPTGENTKPTGEQKATAY